MPAEMRDNDTDSCRRLQHICPVSYFHCYIVDNQFRHISPLANEAVSRGGAENAEEIKTKAVNFFC
jgi:hypothetical protein